MFVAAKCPCCGESICHDINCKVTGTIENGEYNVEVTDVRVNDSCSQEELVDSIVGQIRAQKIRSADELREILGRVFGIASVGCPDVVRGVENGIGVVA